jgi:hypothetical protein
VERTPVHPRSRLTNVRPNKKAMAGADFRAGLT